jgi:hypothetical protein
MTESLRDVIHTHLTEIKSDGIPGKVRQAFLAAGKGAAEKRLLAGGANWSNQAMRGRSARFYDALNQASRDTGWDWNTARVKAVREGGKAIRAELVLTKSGKTYAWVSGLELTKVKGKSWDYTEEAGHTATASLNMKRWGEVMKLLRANRLRGAYELAKDAMVELEALAKEETE